MVERVYGGLLPEEVGTLLTAHFAPDCITGASVSVDFGRQRENSAQGRNRTTDTGIFSPRRGMAKSSNARQTAKEVNRTASPVHQRSPAARHGESSLVRFGAGSETQADPEVDPSRASRSRAAARAKRRSSCSTMRSCWARTDAGSGWVKMLRTSVATKLCGLADRVHLGVHEADNHLRQQLLDRVVGRRVHLLAERVESIDVDGGHRVRSFLGNPFADGFLKDDAVVASLN